MKSQGLNALLQARADMAEVPCFVFNSKPDLLYYNQAWLNWRQSTLDVELGHKPFEFFHPDDGRAFFQQLRQSSSHSAPIEAECRVLRGDGHYVWMGFIFVPIFSAKDLFVGGLAYAKDVSVRKRQAEEAQLFSAITASMETGIIIKDDNGRILDWSPGAVNIMGYTREDAIGKTSDIYTHRPNLNAISEVNQHVLQGEHTSFIRTEVLHKDGHLIICSTTFSPIMGENGKVVGSVVIFHDVTTEKVAEQKRLEAEEALRKAHTEIDGILREIPTPICIVCENDKRILECNAAFASLCSTRAQNINGRLMTDFFFGTAAADNTSDFLLAQARASLVCDCQLRKADGSAAHVEIVGRQLQFTGKDAFGLHCLDLTSREMHEKALRDAASAAEEASRMKSTFLANMSHEIRTPLNGVIGFAELALDEPDVTHSVKNYLNNIKVSAHGLLEIINDVLDISKIEAGKIDLEKAPFDLHNDIIVPCETIMSGKAQEKGVILYFYAEPVVARKFVGDQTRLRQILLNLLSNAVKFTNVGIVKLMLTVESHTDEQAFISFEVKDSGIGMSPEQIHRIFEPFTQADSSTTRKYGGTGLGLAISKNLIELMGGTLHVESAQGIGTRFTFALPFETLPEQANVGKTVDVKPTVTEKPMFTGEVLVCEDNGINQQVIREHLAKVGLDSVIVENGKLGLEQIKTRMREGSPFDLILMDIHMPVMDGLEATQKMHELGVTTPIIALTANAMSTDRKKYLTHGMTDYLAKPFKAQDLWACLSRHLKPVGFAVIGESLAAKAEKETGAQTSILGGAEALVDSSMPVLEVEPAINLPNTVLNRELGKENAAGDENLYQRLLVNFQDDNREAASHLAQALRDDLKLAHRLAHTMKSVAAMIGAVALSEVARDMELSLKKKDLATAQALMTAYTTGVEAVLNELDAANSGAGTASAAPAKFDTVKAHELLNRLEPLLVKADSESLEYLNSIATVLILPNDVGQLLADQIDNYDFDLALTTLRNIRASL